MPAKPRKQRPNRKAAPYRTRGPATPSSLIGHLAKRGSKDRVGQQRAKADWADGVQIGHETGCTVRCVADRDERIVAAVLDMEIVADIGRQWRGFSLRDSSNEGDQ